MDKLIGICQVLESYYQDYMRSYKKSDKNRIENYVRNYLKTLPGELYWFFFNLVEKLLFRLSWFL